MVDQGYTKFIINTFLNNSLKPYRSPDTTYIKDCNYKRDYFSAFTTTAAPGRAKR